MKTIGETAELAGVTIETLRHYDRIGLLMPRARSNAGYRLYGRDELVRLREILVWRQLGFPLGDIAALIDDPAHHRAEALRRQRELAGAQRRKFDALTRGLDVAIAAIDAGLSLTEDEVFSGFDTSLSDDECNANQATREPTKTIPTFALLSGRSVDSSRGVGDAPSQRIVATDPIRLAESLMALGIVPVGTGTYEDRHTQARGVWPWPPTVEQAVRERIADIGYYGSDKGRIERTTPDLILELQDVEHRFTLAARHSSDECSYEWLSGLAPTVLVDMHLGTRGSSFLHRLPQIARAVGRLDRVPPLERLWNARTAVLAQHLRAKTVTVLGLWGNDLFLARESVGPQIFTAVGLDLEAIGDPPEADEPFYKLSWSQLNDLRGETLFVSTRCISSGEVRELLAGEQFRRIPAIYQGRVFDLGWTLINSGWFSAHWQLEAIGHAFELVRLRSRRGGNDLLAAIDPLSGIASFATTGASARYEIHVPLFPAFTVEVEGNSATQLALGSPAARRLCTWPEAALVAADDFESPFVLDHESALAHVA